MEEEKFLKDRIDEEEVKIPESLLPENIGTLLNKASAENSGHKRRSGKTVKRSMIYRIAAAAAVLTVVLGVTGACLLSRGSVKDGSTSQAGGLQGEQTYEDIYSKISEKEAGSLLDRVVYYLGWDSGITDGAMSSGSDMASTDVMEESWNNSVSGVEIHTETEKSEEFSATNLQELGVDEGDVYKTDGKYIYILKEGTYGSGGRLVILEADHGTLSKVSETELEVWEGYDSLYVEEMYVDGDRLAVVGSAVRKSNSRTSEAELGENNERELTFALIYDISDRSAPKELDGVKQSGFYISSRKSDGVLYLFSSYDTFDGYRKKNYDSYIPACDGELIGAADVYCPEELTYIGYTVIGSVDFRNPDGYIDSEAVMLNSANMYVSGSAIYFMGGNSSLGGEHKEGSRIYAYQMSDLVKISYDKGELNLVNTVQVPGSADSQFSFSEYEGKLRLVTTASRYVKYSNSQRYDYDSTCTGLYIFDEDMRLVGSVEDLAQGERVKSSRFIGNMAYFVTFRQTDPLFTVDVSDPANPVILSELKVSGFSEYMHPYGDGKMLGIGYEADENGRTSYLKLSMFDISDGADVTEESRFLLAKAVYSGALYDHKLVLINPEKNIFGFVSSYEQFDSEGYWTEYYELYQLFTYDKEQGFVELLSCRLTSENYFYYDRYYSPDGNYVLDFARALYIGDYLYILDYDYGIEIYDLTDYSYVGKWTEE